MAPMEGAEVRQTIAIALIFAGCTQSSGESGSSSDAVDADTFIGESSVGRVVTATTPTQGRIEFHPIALATIGQTTLADAALTSLTFTITKIEGSKTGELDTWVPIYADAIGVTFDLIAGTTANNARIGLNIDPGSYRYFYVAVLPTGTYARGANCVDKKVTYKTSGTYGGIAATVGESLARGQDVSSATILDWVPDPSFAPTGLHDAVDSGLFWILAGPTVITAGKTTVLKIGALATEALTVNAPCAQSPGLPFLFMGRDAQLTDASREINVRAHAASRSTLLGSCTFASQSLCYEYADIDATKGRTYQTTCTGTWSDAVCQSLERVSGCQIAIGTTRATVWYYPPNTATAIDSACATLSGNKVSP